MQFKLAIIAMVFISGCAKIPAVSSKYFLTKSSLRVDVVRSLSCDSSGLLAAANVVTPVIANSADLDAAQDFNLQELRGPFTDPDVKVEYYEDGRLKSINATQTGTARQVVESVLDAAGALRAGREEDGESSEFDACEYIKKHGDDKTEVLTLQYSGALTVPKNGSQKIDPIGVSQLHHKALFNYVGDITAHVGSSNLKRLDHPVAHDAKEQPSLLVARQLTEARFEVYASGGRIWQGAVLLALPGNEYGIPIPDSAAFGKQEFVVTFADSGALETLQYVSESGAADAGALLQSTIEGARGPSAADQAKAVQAEADLIKQQQRLAKCRANPVECE